MSKRGRPKKRRAKTPTTGDKISFKKKLDAFLKSNSEDFAPIVEAYKARYGYLRNLGFKIPLES